MAAQTVTILGVIYDINNTHHIHLNNQDLTDIPREVFQLTNLKNLSIANNQITEIPDEIINLQQLMFLYFQDNQITTISENLLGLPNLRMIMLYRNPLTITNIRFLKRLKQEHHNHPNIYATINGIDQFASQQNINRIINNYERPQRVGTRMAREVAHRRVPSELVDKIGNFLHEQNVNVPRIEENNNHAAYRTVYPQLRNQKLNGRNIGHLKPKNMKHFLKKGGRKHKKNTRKNKKKRSKMTHKKRRR